MLQDLLVLIAWLAFMLDQQSVPALVFGLGFRLAVLLDLPGLAGELRGEALTPLVVGTRLSLADLLLACRLAGELHCEPVATLMVLALKPLAGALGLDGGELGEEVAELCVWTRVRSIVRQ